MSEEKSPMSWRDRFRLAVHWLVRIDPELMSGCPALDRFHMQAKAVLLLAVAGIALFAWGAFLLLFYPWYIALPLLCPIMVWIVMIDQFMGSARWNLQGVLKPPAKPRQLVFSWVVILGLLTDNGPVFLRLGIASVTSGATSLSATIAVNHATIARQEDEDRDTENAARRAAGEREKQQTWRDILGADDAAVKQAAAGLDTLKQQIGAARAQRENAAGLVTDNQVDADCEQRGGRGSGCHAGKGPRYHKALIRSAAAAAAMRRAAGDLAGLEAHLPDAEAKYQDALRAFRAREPDYLKAAREIDERVARNVVPAGDDPVMAYMALQKVFASPNGLGARFYSHLILTLLLTVELSYVLVSEYFGHATVYMARLIARTKIEAAKAAGNYRREMADLYSQQGGDPRTTFRAMPRLGSDD